MPESFTGTRFRRLDRGPLLGRCPGSRWRLAPCSWTPRFLKSSIPQVTSRASALPPPIAQRKQASLVEGLRHCSRAPRFFNSSSTQETSRADSISGPEEHCSDQILHQLVHLVHSHVKYVQCYGVNQWCIPLPV